jgi:gliding motility-associated-like protein
MVYLELLPLGDPMKKLLVLTLILLANSSLFSQLDIKHYVPPLYARVNVQNHYMILSTPSTAPVTVDVRNGQGTIIYSTVITDVAPNVTLLGVGYASPGIIGTAELNMINPTDGFIIDASAPIYVNLRHVQNWQGLSLNSKGASTGLGTRFRSGHIFQSSALPFVKAHEISVMATVNNTTVTFTDISPNVIFRNTPVTGTTSNDITVVLNAGESYTIAAWLDEPGATGNVNDVNGTLITSDKPIACNTGSWLGGAFNNLRDIGVDQIVPVANIGEEYIFVEGDGVPQTERPLIVAEYDNTSIYVNGSAVPTATINAGQYIYLPQTAYSANDNIYIVTSQPAYMYQSMSGASPAATGLNFIPALRCNGFKKVVIPSVNLVGVPTVSITARTNASVFVNGSLTPLTGGLTVPGNSCWLTYKIPGGTGDFVVQSDSIINVALLTLQGPRGSAGYFTGFTQFTQIDQGDTSSFIVCVDSASSFVTYSIEGPYIDFSATFHDPALNGQVIVDGFNGDSLFFTYIGDPNTLGPDSLDLKVCKILDCCGAVPDTICEITTLVFTNIADIQTGIGDSIIACADTSAITLENLLIGPFDPNGYWVDTDNTGALFGNSFNVSAVTPGIYHFTYYVDGGSICFDSTVVEIEVLAMTTSTCCSIAPSYVLVEPTCNGFTDGSILITDSWATLYSIDAGVTTQATGSFNSIGANTYDVNLTFGPDCVYDTTIVINEPAILAATFILDSVSCFGLCDGQITANTTGGTTPYLYSLGGAPTQSSNSYTGLCAGPAVITITDSNNCVTVLPNTILEPTLLTLSETSHIDETCTAANGSTTVTPLGGTAPYTYTINAGPSQSSSIFAGLSAGAYTVEVTDLNGCTSQLNIVIVDSPSPVPFIDVLNNVTCAGGLNGSVTIGVNLGTAPFLFSLDAGLNQASNSFSAVGAGPHTVNVTDANGCIGTVVFNITQPTALTYSTVVNDALCFGSCDGWIAISANGAVPPYQYSDDNGLTFQALDTLQNLCAGNVNVVVSDANGCLANSVESINEPTALTSVQGFVNPFCYQTPTGEISFAPSGGTAPYQFSVDNGLNFSSSSPIINLMAGIYDVIVQDTNGCQFTSQVTLTDPPPFTFSFLANNPSNCGANDGSFEITATGGTAPYFYSIDGGTTIQVNNGFFLNLFSGLYNLEVTDADGCVDSTFSALSDNTMITQTDLTVDVTCFGGSNGLGIVSQQFGAPPFTYTLNTNTTSQPSGVFPGLSAGVYFITIQDAGLCIGIEQFEIFQPDSITFTNPIVNITCPNGADGQIDFANEIGGDNGPYTYSIDGGVTYFATSLFTGLTSGSYTVFAQDGIGCLGSAVVVLSEPNPWDVVINFTNLTCNSNNTGFIQVVGDGATAPYTYTVSGTNASGIFPGLAANAYNITVTDALGCTLDTNQTLTEPATLTMVNALTNPLCFGSADGEISVAAAGGTAPYLYSSDGGTILQSSNLLNGLADGCYDVYVQDNNSCTVTINECINQPTLLTMNIATNPATCGNNNADISIVAANGTPGYTYSKDDGATFQASNIFNGLAAIPFDLVLEDANGCQIDSTMILTADPEPVIDNIVFTNPLCFGGNDGTLTITSSSGIGVHQYGITSALGPFQGSNNFTGLADGNYTVFVQDGNGCVVQSNVTLTQPPIIQVNSVVTDLTCFQNATGIINVSGLGGTTPYQFSNDNGLTFQGIGQFTGLSAGNYNVVIEDVNGCQITAVENVNEPLPLSIVPFTVVQPSCFGFCDGTVTAVVNGGTITTDYIYTWSTTLTNTVSNQALNVCAGIYSLIAEDDNGCTIDTLNFVVGEPAEAIIDSVVTTPVLCWGDSNGGIEIFSPNAGFYSIGLGFTANNQFAGLPTGIYTAYVQDVNGCPGDSVDVFVATPQELTGFVTPDEYICQGDTVYFSVIGTGGTQPYIFDVNNGNSNSALIVEPIFSDTSYFVNITDVNGCTFDTDTMNVFVAPPPVLVTSNDTTICPGQPVGLSSLADDLVETYTYLWDTGDTIPYIYPIVSSDTTFYVTVTDECNVSTIDSISVNLFLDPIVTLVPDITGGCPPFQINYSIVVNQGLLASDLFWTTNYGTIDSSNFTNIYITYSVPGSGNLDLSFTSSNGCQVDTTFVNLVDVYGIPEAIFTMNPDPPSIFDTQVNLTNLSIDYTSNWWFFLGDSTNTEHSSIAVANLPVDTTVIVCLVVENNFGCYDTTCQSLLINNELLLYVPNCIILDGYSNNNIFKPVTNYFHPDWYQLYIFNRWGELLFETEDVNQGWDGSYNGVIVEDGVYVWKIIGAPMNNEADLREWTGHVTVIK